MFPLGKTVVTLFIPVLSILFLVGYSETKVMLKESKWNRKIFTNHAKLRYTYQIRGINFDVRTVT